MELRKVIISGGGTGGHVFPALAIANELKRKHRGIEILFVGALGKMEMEKIPKYGYDIVGLPIAGLQRKLSFQNLSLPYKLAKSLIQSYNILRKFKPQAVIGTGGYASASIGYAAAKMNIPLLIQEQNSFAGMTNKRLGKSAQKICVAYEGMEQFFPKENLVLTGNPVREVFYNLPLQAIALKHFFLSQDKKTILVTGGSLGAKAINVGVEKSLKIWLDKGYQVIWQTGKNFDGSKYHNPENGCWVGEFVEKMEIAYAAADIVVSRAGAIALSEITLIGKCALLVPSPWVAENHQWHNAMALVNKKAAQLIEEVDVNEKLANSIIYLLNDDILLDKIREKAKNCALPKAAESIVVEIEEMIK